MEKMVRTQKMAKFFNKTIIVVFTVLCVLTFSACRLQYTVKNARFKSEFLWVYAEQDFNIKKAGTIQGTFKLPKDVKYKGLNFEVMFPAIFRKNWGSVVKMPCKLTLSWNGGSLVKEDLEAKSNWHGINLWFHENEISHVPVKQEITYTLEYGVGVYTELNYYSGGEKVDKLADLEAHPESYSGFYDAVFVVAEQSTKKMP